MSSIGVSDEVFDGFVLLPDFSQSRRATTISTILILCTDVLIADPLCAGDEKLVLLLPPDSPSPPDYSDSPSACVFVCTRKCACVCTRTYTRALGRGPKQKNENFITAVCF